MNRSHCYEKIGSSSYISYLEYMLAAEINVVELISVSSPVDSCNTDRQGSDNSAPPLL